MKVSIPWCRKGQPSDGGFQSGGVGSILLYIRGRGGGLFPVGGSPLHAGRINKIGLHRRGSSLTMGNPAVGFI